MTQNTSRNIAIYTQIYSIVWDNRVCLMIVWLAKYQQRDPSRYVNVLLCLVTKITLCIFTKKTNILEHSSFCKFFLSKELNYYFTVSHYSY